MNDSTDSRSARAMTSRLYESERDLEQMEDLVMEMRSHAGDWRCAHVGELVFEFWMVACHLNPNEFIRLWLDDGKPVGYAILGEDPSLDCQVLPEYAWRGIEDEALAWAEARVADLRRRNARQWGSPLVSGARADDARRIEFLERHGFRRGEYCEVNLIRALDGPIPDAALPAGCRVRAVEPDEISNRASAQREVWHPWTVGNVGDDDYAYMMALPGYERELDVVSVARDGVIAAYVNGWIDPVNRVGDLGPVGARTAYRRQGFTRAALLECLRRMQARGMTRAIVSTGVSNVPARRLYESVGFRVVNSYIEYVKAQAVE